MSTASKIEWTRGDDGSAGATWNPVTGCTKVSSGCDHCYAETFAERWRGVPGHPYEHGFDVQLRPERLGWPLRWRKPRRVFVNSMSDLFHQAVPDEFIARVFAVMALTPQHTYQVLTKRPSRMRALLDHDRDGRAAIFRTLVATERERLDPHCGDGRWPLPNVWLGTSVESQKWADIRVPLLLGTPAAVRFVSCEPLLERVDLCRWLGVERLEPLRGYVRELNAVASNRVGPAGGLHWVIIGGESGPGARVMDPAWARDLLAQCRTAHVPVFVKQMGSVVGRLVGAGSKGGDWDAWPEEYRVRQYPTAAGHREATR